MHRDGDGRSIVMALELHFSLHCSYISGGFEGLADVPGVVGSPQGGQGGPQQLVTTRWHPRMGLQH
jgi:hypothetical protein